MEVRQAEEAEIDHLASIWYDGWQDTHARILPAELTRVRTLASFNYRLRAALADTRVVGPTGAPVGFCIIKSDALYQLYVAAQSRGSPVAVSLIADAESRFRSKSGDTRSNSVTDNPIGRDR